MTTDFEGNKICESIKKYTLKTAKLCEDLGHIVEEFEINLNPMPIHQAWKVIPAVNLLYNMQKRADFLGIQLKSSHLEELNWAWLEEGAHLYVCGDAKRMARDVDMVLREIVTEQGGLAEDATNAYIASLKKDKRYLRDVY